jgi:hypothetical protein
VLLGLAVPVLGADLLISDPPALELLAPQAEGGWHLTVLAGLEQVVPGDLVMVSQAFRVPDGPQEGAFSLTLAIPDELEYVPGTAVGPGARRLVSTNYGETFVTDGAGRKGKAGVRITHLRWIFTGTLQPGVLGYVRYRAVKLPPLPQITTDSLLPEDRAVPGEN